jgi:hypothetical protein
MELACDRCGLDFVAEQHAGLPRRSWAEGVLSVLAASAGWDWTGRLCPTCARGDADER